MHWWYNNAALNLQYSGISCVQYPMKLLQSDAVVTQSIATWYTEYSTAITKVECLWDFVLTIDTPYLAREGELWGVYCENFGENWLCYNSNALYFSEHRTPPSSYPHPSPPALCSLPAHPLLSQPATQGCSCGLPQHNRPHILTTASRHWLGAGHRARTAQGSNIRQG